MEITATSKYDQKTITALTHASVFRKHNPKKCMILFIALDGLIITLSILLSFLNGELQILFLCWDAVCVLMQFYIFLWLPKIQYRAMGKFAESCQTFQFTDDTVIITSSIDEYTGSSSIAYNMLYGVMETDDYLFLFKTKRQAFIVDKSTVQSGTVSELRAKLANIPGVKYILCNY